jgi:hypothetical protein
MACPTMPKPSKTNQNRKKPTVKPRPFRSILLPYAQDILAWRRAGMTWQEVVNELGKKGIQTDTSAACRFIKRYRRKPYPIGAEPEESPAPVPDQPAKSTPSKAKPSPEELADQINAKVDRDHTARQSARKMGPVDFDS